MVYEYQRREISKEPLKVRCVFCGIEVDDFISGEYGSTWAHEYDDSVPQEISQNTVQGKKFITNFSEDDSKALYPGGKIQRDIWHYNLTNTLILDVSENSIVGVRFGGESGLEYGDDPWSMSAFPMRTIYFTCGTCKKEGDDLIFRPCPICSEKKYNSNKYICSECEQTICEECFYEDLAMCTLCKKKMEFLKSESENLGASIADHTGISDRDRFQKLYNALQMSDRIPFSVLLGTLNFNSTNELFSWLFEVGIMGLKTDYETETVYIADSNALEMLEMLMED